MAKIEDSRLWVGNSNQLIEWDYLRLDVEFSGDPSSVVVFRYKGQCLAYRNLCVHMPRELDCEKDMIFDVNGLLLRCSMHGIVYDPLTGKSLSTLCAGERLTSIKVQEDEQGIWIRDRRVKSRHGPL